MLNYSDLSTPTNNRSLKIYEILNSCQIEGFIKANVTLVAPCFSHYSEGAPFSLFKLRDTTCTETLNSCGIDSS